LILRDVTVLRNQQNLFPAETVLARTELNRLLAVVQLYKALGGGWTASEAVASSGRQSGDTSIAGFMPAF
jgi:outer membrane protein TolC